MSSTAGGTFVGKNDITIMTTFTPVTITIPFELVKGIEGGLVSKENGTQFQVNLVPLAGRFGELVEKITCSIPITVFSPSIITFQILRGSTVIFSKSVPYITNTVVSLNTAVRIPGTLNAVFSVVVKVPSESSITISRNRTLAFSTALGGVENSLR